MDAGKFMASRIYLHADAAINENILT